ncbi:MAG: NAD(P)-binding domain-containing protein [Anaerolineae bacterium]|nr:NAD(P)-binding domain-containing protein [Anaerolineae bacterium]
MSMIYYEADANPAALAEQRISVLGYGNIGRSIALNLQDSGHIVTIGNAEDDYAEQASRDGFDVISIAEAAATTTLKFLTVSDEVMPELYLTLISPSLKAGDSLVFTSGYNVAFGFIEPPPFVDVMLIAPRTTGIGVRESFRRGSGFPSFLAVSQDASGRAWDRLLAVALALRTLKAGAMELTFRQEAELDLFTQQTILPALHAFIQTAADVLIKEGYPPEAVLLDLYASGELGYVLDKAAQTGLQDSMRFLSQIAQYSILSRIERYNEPKLRRQMETVLGEVRSGKFAQEWAMEYANGYLRLDSLRQRRATSALWDMERQTIEQFNRNDEPPDISDDRVETSW